MLRNKSQCLLWFYAGHEQLSTGESVDLKSIRIFFTFVKQNKNNYITLHYKSFKECHGPLGVSGPHFENHYINAPTELLVSKDIHWRFPLLHYILEGNIIKFKSSFLTLEIAVCISKNKYLFIFSLLSCHRDVFVDNTWPRCEILYILLHLSVMAALTLQIKILHSA